MAPEGRALSTQESNHRFKHSSLATLASPAWTGQDCASRYDLDSGSAVQKIISKQLTFKNHKGLVPNIIQNNVFRSVDRGVTGGFPFTLVRHL